MGPILVLCNFLENGLFHLGIERYLHTILQSNPVIKK